MMQLEGPDRLVSEPHISYTTLMIKKSSKSKHISKNKTHIMLKKGIVIYSMLVFLGFILVSLSALALTGAVVAHNNNQRLDRINTIYTDLELDDSYRVADSNIFGDKRAYDWGEGRTFASSLSFGRNANRIETFDDLKTHIEAAGFEQIEGPNYGDIARQDHYRSAQGEYIRVSIDTKAWHDAILYGTSAPQPGSDTATKTGPVYITIKVNLDDNNE